MLKMYIFNIHPLQYDKKQAASCPVCALAQSLRQLLCVLTLVQLPLQ